MQWTLIEKGGPIMWLLLGLSLLGVIVFIERTLFLHQGKVRTSEFLSGIKNLLRKGRLLEALTQCEETSGPMVNVVKASLLHYNADEARMRAAIQSAALVELPVLERRVGTIAAIAKIAPLLGLLGTLTSVLQAFFRLQSAGPYANSSAFAGDFAQALMTTAVGVAIAITAHLSYHFLNGRIRALVHDMEWVGNEMMQFLLSELPLDKKEKPVAG